MRHTAQISFRASDRDRLLSSDDGALSFIVRRGGRAAYVERLQPLAGRGKLSHLMRFDDLEAFDRTHAVDQMRYTYPLLYSRLRQVVAEVLQA